MSLLDRESEHNSAALNALIRETLKHVARIETEALDARMTVREYRNLQAEGIADPLSPEYLEIRRLRRELEAKTHL